MTDIIRKSFTTETKALDIDQGIYQATISTETVDRTGDIVRATGGQFDNWMKNPVVLYAHNYSGLPVAKGLSIVAANQKVVATFQFPAWGVSPEADTVRRLWAAGFLNATSIGFLPSEQAPVEGAESDGFYTPQEFIKWELLEFSIVPVPANQEALRMAVKALEDTNPKTPEQSGDTPHEDGAGPVGSNRSNNTPTWNDAHLRELNDVLEKLLNYLKGGRHA